ncbi:hypothetical protein AV530_019447 [Patagioenas fasciata monilis]|uniref:Uncharacterized protein n=1 Tax=Patagioenas fasciata monilis TaxID=372326 RepID=A0A1V4JDH8_PATFA|nr:hypothetical protein AV530_019447 [Patagioenas fasciata monilis]
MSHDQRLAEVKQLGNLLLLLCQPPPPPGCQSSAVGQHVSGALGLSWAGTQSLAGAEMVRGENSGLPHSEERGVVPMSCSAASGNTGVLGVGLVQAALVARQSLVQDVSSHTCFLCSEEMFVHGCLRLLGDSVLPARTLHPAWDRSLGAPQRKRGDRTEGQAGAREGRRDPQPVPAPALPVPMVQSQAAGLVLCCSGTES